MAEAYREGAISISTDPARLDLDVIHGFLTRSYWSEGISKDRVAQAIRGSLCFGLFEGERQIGFARAVTDGAVIGFLADVFVIESHQGRGFGKLVMRTVMAHPALRTISKWRLVTKDAHGLYEQFGFGPLAKPEMHMELLRPELIRD